MQFPPKLAPSTCLCHPPEVQIFYNCYEGPLFFFSNIHCVPINIYNILCNQGNIAHTDFLIIPKLMGQNRKP